MSSNFKCVYYLFHKFSISHILRNKEFNPCINGRGFSNFLRSKVFLRSLVKALKNGEEL